MKSLSIIVSTGYVEPNTMPSISEIEFMKFFCHDVKHGRFNSFHHSAECFIPKKDKRTERFISDVCFEPVREDFKFEFIKNSLFDNLYEKNEPVFKNAICFIMEIIKKERSKIFFAPSLFLKEAIKIFRDSGYTIPSLNDVPQYYTPGSHLALIDNDDKPTVEVGYYQNYYR